MSPRRPLIGAVYETAMVVILDGEEHQFRTNYHKKHPLICDYLHPHEVSDRAIWNGSEGENEGKDQPRIVPGPSGLASDHVIGVYEYAHRIDMERVWVDMLWWLNSFTSSVQGNCKNREFKAF